jgi:hypothetical protein
LSESAPHDGIISVQPKLSSLPTQNLHFDPGLFEFGDFGGRGWTTMLAFEVCLEIGANLWTQLDDQVVVMSGRLEPQKEAGDDRKWKQRLSPETLHRVAFRGL